jgi:PAS domain S-box-containing protein
MCEIQPVHPGLEALDDGFYMVDAAWRVTYWNRAAERLLGISREEVLGRVLWGVFPYLQESATGDCLREALREQSSRRCLDSHPPGLPPGVLSVQAAPARDGGVVVQIHEATDEIRRSEHYLGLLESIRDGFFAVDEQWNLVYLNPIAETLLRLSRDRALGTSLWPLLPREPPEIAETLRATMQDGIQRHLRDVRPAGRVFRGRVFDLWVYPLAGGGISVLFEDVSERLQREKELARLAAEAQEANRAKARFFAAISHELRTPLNAIVGYTYLLSSQAYGAMPAGAQRAADRTTVCAEHLSRLVDDVLLMTTAEVGRLPVTPAPVSLGEFLPGVIEPLRHQAEAKGLRFGIRIAEDLPPIETDPQRLRQLLTALISNAVKFTSRGEVRLDVLPRGGPDHSDDSEEESYSLFPDSHVELRVVDSGPGIAPEDRERIFDAFEQVGDPARSQSMYRGTGLGLTIARQLSNLLCGDLSVGEAPGGGSIFRLRLPIAYPSRRG